MIIIKNCKDCEKSKSLSEYYGQEKTKANGQKYIYYQPYCKECSIERSRNRQLENHEDYKEYTRNHHRYNRKHNKKMIEYDRKHAREQKDSGYAKEYYEKNKDYFINYNRERMMNKTHEISNEEWLRCKEYFNNSCAYCGLHEDDHYIIYAGELRKTDLHKEHVNHVGSNKIDNCVPACQMCNCKKWAFRLEDWYNEEYESYSEERLNKIIKWLEVDHILI